ncbi:tRNA (cmo5U34)-methyltransferase [uncultured archaeon]|nr:tRNA (cmo5U34)-methyltransferase [uncultured archaeon]
MLSALKKYFLLIRLYTVINIILISLIPTILFLTEFDVNILRDVAIGILFWTTIILGKEVMHSSTDHREHTNKIIPITLGIILVFCIGLIHTEALIFLFIALITFVCYSLKNKNWLLAPISFIFRGFLEVLILVTILSFYLPILKIFETYWIILLSIFLITCSRNLLGDLRDIEKDKYTLPKRVGVDFTKIVIMFLAIAPILIIRFDILIPIFIVVVLLFTMKNDYLLHKIYVQATGFFVLNIISVFLINNTLLTNAGFFVVLLNNTYEYTPRDITEKSNTKSAIKSNKIHDILNLIINLGFNKRFRMDVKALTIAKKGYNWFAWETLDSIGGRPYLEKGTDLNELSSRLKIKNLNLLEYLLDLLTGEKVLAHREEKYYLIKIPHTLAEAELNYMKKHYPASHKWTFSMVPKAKNTLLTGKTSFNSSFDEEQSAILWDKLMSEAPYSFRKLAIKSFTKLINKNDKILDLGCGTGTSLMNILDEMPIQVNLSGTDPSSKSIRIAKDKIDIRLQKEGNTLKLENLKRAKLFTHNILDKPLNEKYKIIFLSFVINHIPVKKRTLFYKRIYAALEDGGFCVIYQLTHKAKQVRTPMWVMHNVPSQQEFPFLDKYLSELESVFGNVKTSFDGLITISKKDTSFKK